MTFETSPVQQDNMLMNHMTSDYLLFCNVKYKEKLHDFMYFHC